MRLQRSLLVLSLLSISCAEALRPSGVDRKCPSRLPQLRRMHEKDELLAAAALSEHALPEVDANVKEQQRALRATILSFVVTFAFAFVVVLPYKGRQGMLDFITGFLVEKSLSVDNLFVFLMLFDYFRVPAQYTDRVLRWGIISALVLRGFMIAIGVAAVQQCRPVLLVFSLILVVSSVKMMMPEGDEELLKDNAVMKIARWSVNATDAYDGDRFFTRVGGIRRATPMLVVLICIELSDVLFAVDSIPAVVGITHDPFIVYTSNIFALMALRSLYTILSTSVQQLIYLRHAVAAILGFVGVKMAMEFFHHGISSAVSLGVIFGLLTIGTAASLLRNRAKLAARLSVEQPPSPPHEEVAPAARMSRAEAARESRREEAAERASLEEAFASLPATEQPSAAAAPQSELHVAPGYRRFSWQRAALRVESALVEAANNLME